MRRISALPRLRRQSRHAGFARHRAAETLARPERRKLLRHRLASRGLPRGNQDTGAGAKQRLGADAAKPGRPARDQRRAAPDGKKARLLRSSLPAPLPFCEDHSNSTANAKVTLSTTACAAKRNGQNHFCLGRGSLRQKPGFAFSRDGDPTKNLLGTPYALSTTPLARLEPCYMVFSISI